MNSAMFGKDTICKALDFKTSVKLLIQCLRLAAGILRFIPFLCVTRYVSPPFSFLPKNRNPNAIEALCWSSQESDQRGGFPLVGAPQWLSFAVGMFTFPGCLDVISYPVTPGPLCLLQNFCLEYR